jgi:hypothetical protein
MIAGRPRRCSLVQNGSGSRANAFPERRFSADDGHQRDRSHRPERSARADRVFPAAIHLVSKSPIWLADAPQPETDFPPKIQGIARIMTQKRGVVQSFIFSQPTERRLSRHSVERMPTVLSGSCGEHVARHRHESERIVTFAVGVGLYLIPRISI